MSPREPYFTLETPCEQEIDPIKGSRFTAYLFPIADESGFKQMLADIKSLHPHARHWCWAWQTKQQSRSDDDGEPKNSAGKPILAQLQGAELFDAGLVVVRYFGGTKLGVGGLVRAYGTAAGAVIKTATFVTVTPKTRLVLTYRYDDTAAVNTVLAQYAHQVVTSDFAEAIYIALDVDDGDAQSFIDALTDMTSGRVCPKRCA